MKQQNTINTSSTRREYVINGSLRDHLKIDAAARLHRLGATVALEVGASTTAVVAGLGGSHKVSADAVAFGVPIISERDLQSLPGWNQSRLISEPHPEPETAMSTTAADVGEINAAEIFAHVTALDPRITFEPERKTGLRRVNVFVDGEERMSSRAHVGIAIHAGEGGEEIPGPGVSCWVDDNDPDLPRGDNTALETIAEDADELVAWLRAELPVLRN